jgi:uncharacterized membrane protein
MGLAVLILGLALFIGTHVFVSFRRARARLMARMGEGSYKLVFSLVSALGILLIIYGFGLYRSSGWIEFWPPPAWTRHLAAALMWPAVILIFAAYLPGYIKRWVRHPMLAGVILWALAHLVANGDLGSVILFGSLLAWAIYDWIAVRTREVTAETAAANIAWRNDAVAVVVGTLIYLALGFTFHPAVIGVAAFTG